MPLGYGLESDKESSMANIAVSLLWNDHLQTVCFGWICEAPAHDIRMAYAGYLQACQKMKLQETHKRI